jgi:hypothetical protein
MEVLVKEQVVVQRDWFASFRLLTDIAEALERLSPWQMGLFQWRDWWRKGRYSQSLLLM